MFDDKDKLKITEAISSAICAISDDITKEVDAAANLDRANAIDILVDAICKFHREGLYLR